MLCHRADYDGTAEPVHAGVFDTRCQNCHLEDSWVPAVPVAHDWFRIDGAHLLITCAACHVGEPAVYAGTPTQCVGCHQEQFDNAEHEGHQTFPTTCQDCHTTTAWEPALEGAHPNDRFRIDGGDHQYRCLDCHDPDLGSSAMGQNCDCVGCHEGEHTRDQMDGEHGDVDGYPRGPAPPNFCVDCHPDGNE